MQNELRARVKSALKRRHKARKTQFWLAAEIGIAPSHLSDILSGHRSPSLSVATRLEDATGIPAREFLADEVTA